MSVLSELSGSLIRNARGAWGNRTHSFTGRLFVGRERIAFYATRSFDRDAKSGERVTWDIDLNRPGSNRTLTGAKWEAARVAVKSEFRAAIEKALADEDKAARAEIVSPVDPDRDITADGVTCGLTGPDWEPTADMRFFAQSTDNDMLMAFGATREAALAALAKDGGEPVARAPVDPAPVRLRQLRGPDGQSVLVASPEPESGLIDIMGELRGTGLIVPAPVDPVPLRAAAMAALNFYSDGADDEDETESRILANLLAAVSVDPVPVDPVPALGEIGIASIRRALTLAHGALSPANNSEERQALAALDTALALPAIRQGAGA